MPAISPYRTPPSHLPPWAAAAPRAHAPASTTPLPLLVTSSLPPKLHRNTLDAEAAPSPPTSQINTRGPSIFFSFRLGTAVRSSRNHPCEHRRVGQRGPQRHRHPAVARRGREDSKGPSIRVTPTEATSVLNTSAESSWILPRMSTGLGKVSSIRRRTVGSLGTASAAPAAPFWVTSAGRALGRHLLLLDSLSIRVLQGGAFSMFAIFWRDPSTAPLCRHTAGRHAVCWGNAVQAALDVRGVTG